VEFEEKMTIFVDILEDKSAFLDTNVLAFSRVLSKCWEETGDSQEALFSS